MGKAEFDKHNKNSSSPNNSSNKGGGTGSPSSSSSSLSTLSSILRKYYASAAAAIGLRDTEDGIRAGGRPLKEQTLPYNNKNPIVGALMAGFEMPAIETAAEESGHSLESEGRSINRDGDDGENEKSWPPGSSGSRLRPGKNKS